MDIFVASGEQGLEEHTLADTGDARVTQQKVMEFAEELKNSVVLKRVAVPVLDQPVPTKSEEMIEQMKEFDAAITSNKHLEIYMKCLIGRNLRLLSARKSGTKGKKGVEFIRSVQEKLTAYSPSQIYFLMNLYELSMQYNRLMYVTIGIGVLKSKFKLVKQIVSGEPDYWKNINS